jgi:hypothetical protein
MAGPWLSLTLDIDLAAEPVEGRLAEALERARPSRTEFGD